MPLLFVWPDDDVFLGPGRRKAERRQDPGARFVTTPAASFPGTTTPTSAPHSSPRAIAGPESHGTRPECPLRLCLASTFARQNIDVVHRGRFRLNRFATEQQFGARDEPTIFRAAA